MKKIVITGISGFVGKNLANYLEINGCEIAALNMRNPMSKLVLPEGYDSLIHLAGKAHDFTKGAKMDDYLEINYHKTIDLFNLFIESDLKDFLYFSSVKAVSGKVKGILTEEDIPHPDTSYGISKIMAEDYMRKTVLPKGKRLFILRPCMIHGPGNKGNLNLLFNFVDKGYPYPLGSFENKRSFLSIGNLNYIIHKLIFDPLIQSGTYNLSDDEALSTKEIVSTIGGVLDKKAKIYFVPKPIIRLFATIGTALHLPFNLSVLQKLTEDYVVSNLKIKTAIGVNNLNVSSRKGIIETIRSFKN